MKKFLLFLFFCGQSIIAVSQSTKLEFLTPKDHNASGANFTAGTSTSLTLNWIDGNLGNHIVLIKSGGAVSSDPVNGVTYTASTTFGSGTQVGSGNYVVKIGSGPVTVTGLSANTTYYVAVYSFRGSAGSEAYMTSGAATAYALTYVAEYQTVLDRGTTLGYTLPIYSTQVSQNALLVSLKAYGIWTQLDILYIFQTGATNLSQFATINWVTPASYQVTAVNSPQFTKYGFKGNGTSSYLDTNWIQNTNGVTYTLNDASIFYHQIETALSAGIAVGTSNASFTNRYFSSPLFTASVTYHEINSSTNHSVAAVDGNGFTQDKRTSSTATAKFVNGVSVDVSTGVSTGRSTAKLYALCENQNGTAGLFIANTLGCLGAGGGMTTQNSADLYTAYRTYTATFAAAIPIPRYYPTADFYSAFKDARNEMEGYLIHDIPVNAVSTTGDVLTGSSISHNGVLDAADNLWYIPRQSTGIYRLNTLTNVLTKVFTISNGFTSMYSGGTYVRSLDKIFMCPYYGDVIGVIDNASTGSPSYRTISHASFTGGVAKWGGWCQASDGNLYASPTSATWILCFNPFTETVFELSNCPPGTFATALQYAGSCPHKNEVHFAMLQATTGMYVNVTTQTYGTYGSGYNPAIQKHAGILKSTKTGYLYMVAYGEGKIRKIDGDTHTFVSEVTTTGGCIGMIELPSGLFVGAPHTGSLCVAFDPVSERTWTFGPTFSGGAASSFSGINLTREGVGITDPFNNPTIYKIGIALPFLLDVNYITQPTLNKF